MNSSPPFPTALRVALMVSVCLLAGSSCSVMQRGKRQVSTVAVEKPVAAFQYAAIAGETGNRILAQAYVFPPLRSDAKGNPVESLKPVFDADGRISGWQTSSKSAAALQRVVAERLRVLGYEIVDFKSVVNATEPYSILIVSSFHSSEAVIKDAPAGSYDRSQSVMIKGSVFGLDLDPGKKIDLFKVDGLMNYAAANPPASPQQRAYAEAMRWFGDNVQGSMLLP